MIHKIIHYTWFSNEPFPEKIQKCIASWKSVLSDYEFVLWDRKKIEEIKENTYIMEALKEKKWAYASDYVRLYAVYNYGGIYLDTDVMVYKSFTPLLAEKCFIGKENSFHIVGAAVVSFLTSHCFGAEKGNLFIKKCMDYYIGRPFIASNNLDLPKELRLNMILLPYIQAGIARQEGWKWSYNNKEWFKHPDFTIFPSAYFDAPAKIKDTYCQHLALGSWRESRIVHERITLSYKIKWRVVALLEKILNKLGYVIFKVANEAN